MSYHWSPHGQVCKHHGSTVVMSRAKSYHDMKHSLMMTRTLSQLWYLMPGNQFWLVKQAPERQKWSLLLRIFLEFQEGGEKKRNVKADDNTFRNGHCCWGYSGRWKKRQNVKAGDNTVYMMPVSWLFIQGLAIWFLIPEQSLLIVGLVQERQLQCVSNGVTSFYH